MSLYLILGFLPHRPLQGHGAVGKLCGVGKPLLAEVGDEGDDDYIKIVQSQLIFLGKLGVLKLLQANMHRGYIVSIERIIKNGPGCKSIQAGCKS